jgi:aminoglycoside 6'-N-acetyltransferase
MEFSQGSLKIRPLNLEDGPILYKWLNDPRVLAYYEGRDQPHDMDMIHARFLSKTDVNSILGCLVSWDGVPVGYVQIYPIMKEELVSYGYAESLRVYGMDQFLGETDVWNKGIGTLLVTTVANWLLRNQGANRVIMDPRVDNLRAIHVYEKCGFKRIKLLPHRELHEGKHHDCWLMELRTAIKE